MARKARVKDVFGTYYVTQHSSGRRPLFADDADRTYFIDLLQRTVDKFNCRVVDYCAQDNNTYHLIIDVNGGDLSKIMKSINIPYAMHATCEGKLFKDRYKSQPIPDQEALEQIRKDIQGSVIENGGYSSFCVSEITPCQETESNDCTDCISCIDDAYLRLHTIAALNALTVNTLIKDKARRNLLIKDFRQNSTLSLKNIGELFGGISESTVCKILNQ